MRLFAIALLVLASLAPAHAQSTRYVLGWTSPMPVAIESVVVTGGALDQVLTSGDGTSGTIAASAPRACVSIVAIGHAANGAGVRFVGTWDAQCWHLWLPAVVQ